MKKQSRSTDTNTEMIHKLELFDKDFKADAIKIFNNLLKILLNLQIILKHIKTSIYRESQEEKTETLGPKKHSK